MPDGLWDALGLVTLGVALSLIGRHFRAEYFRTFADEGGDPVYELKKSGARRAVVMLLAGGAVLVIVGIATAGRELLRL